MQRDRLICSLAGWHAGKNPSISAEDLRIKIDNDLISSHFTPLGNEPGDLELIQELLDETVMMILGSQFNRKERRSVRSSK